jgi:hypothetical protein
MTRKFDAVIKYVKNSCFIDFPRYEWVYKELATAFKDGERVTVEVKSRRKPRSLNQNDFYWGYFLQEEIDCFKEFWGEVYDKSQVHDWNKANFFGEIVVVNNTPIRKPGSSADQSTIDFEEKLEYIRQWFRINFDWEICYPNEQKDIF